ncbi:unnamed protein product [Schistosoma curassoni]|uniref:Uncharacterized protein n=1 Tax=Schistosoma curassoni TaxID=6186 RepID=A0A183L472_9TREM|nr:unnamed protein product [Schistosoma curassoni]
MIRIVYEFVPGSQIIDDDVFPKMNRNRSIENHDNDNILALIILITVQIHNEDFGWHDQ